MNFLPIVSRELCVASRRGWSYWIRTIFALAGMIGAMAMFYEVRRAPGGPMLWVLSIVTLGLALFCGGLFTADSISSEKRGDTLGLLFLTNLKGFDIVSGKIAAQAITTACGLLAVFPVFFLPILAGGVTWAETLRVLLAIAVSFVFALSLGVWISARSVDARNAVMAALVILALVVLLPIFWLAMWEMLFRGRVPLAGPPQLSPGMLLFFARDASHAAARGPTLYWTSFGIFLGGSAVFAALASRHLPRSWRDEAGAARPAFWRMLCRKFGREAPRRAIRFDGANPYFDLVMGRTREFSWGGRARAILTAFFFGLLLLSFGPGDDEAFALALMVLLALHAMAKFAFAFDATRALAEEKRNASLELLLATPLPERALAEGAAKAFQNRQRPLMRQLWLLSAGLQFTIVMNDHIGIRGDDHFLVASFLWGPMIWSASDFRTAPWLALRHAVSQSSHLKATLRTLSTMVLFPWAPYFIVLFIMAESNLDEVAAGFVTFAWAFGSLIFRRIQARRMAAAAARDLREMASAPGSLPQGSRAKGSWPRRLADAVFSLARGRWGAYVPGR